MNDAALRRPTNVIIAHSSGSRGVDGTWLRRVTAHIFGTHERANSKRRIKPGETRAYLPHPWRRWNLERLTEMHSYCYAGHAKAFHPL